MSDRTKTSKKFNLGPKKLICKQFLLSKKGFKLTLSRGVIRPIGWSLMWTNQTPKYQFETHPKPCGKPISVRSITLGFWYRISNAWNSIIWRWISFSKFKSNSLKNVTKIFKIGKFQAFKHKIHKSVSISQNVRDWTDDCNESIYIRFTFVVFLLVLSFD